MRGLIERLETPHPIGASLPAVYQEDEFSQRLTAAFDRVLAPVLCTLDNRAAYFDPSVAPTDFVAWLSTWVGIAVDENWPIGRQRALVAGAAELYRWRGTVRGVAAEVAVYTGAEPEIVETGGTTWSPTPGGTLPGRPGSELLVRVRVADPSSVDQRRVEAIVADAKPAHVPFRVEVTS